MDVDNSGSDGQVKGIDVEQSLLQQFSCMGTTDKDELVQQLQRLLGSNLNYSTATFFLDMNNWNLQAAVCSYLDVESANQLPSMALVSDPLPNETESIEPNVSFKKSWHIYNNGNDAWPEGCYAQCSDGVSLGGERVPVGCLSPGEGTLLTVNMTGPSVPGIYQSKWRLCTPRGSFFGDPMWTIVTVVEEGTIELTNQLSLFNQLGFPPQSLNVPNPFVRNQSQKENSQETVPPDGNPGSFHF